MPGSSESRRRKKDPDRDREYDRDMLKTRERTKPSSRSTRKPSSSSTKDREHDPAARDRRPESSLAGSRPRKSSLLPEMERRSSTTSPSGSYPAFSKAHSKEAVGSRENLVNPRLSLYTPDPTIIDSEARGWKPGMDTKDTSAAPPSPPLTAQEPDLRRSKSGYTIRTPSDLEGDAKARPTSLDGVDIPHTKSPSNLSSSSIHKPQASQNGSSLSNSQPYMAVRNDMPGTAFDERSDVQSQGPSTLTQNTVDSQVTPVPRPPTRPPPQSTPFAQRSSRIISDPSPHTPAPLDISHPPTPFSITGHPAVEVILDSNTNSNTNSPQFAQTGFGAAPPPPPPPPPPAPGHLDVPRVDYLLLNGGLPYVLPRNFMTAAIATDSSGNPIPSNQSLPRAYGVQSMDASNVFSPFHKVLDDFLQVVSKNGSVAVATGYRSVARRLLDRLEAVFNRNISSETCDCIMCMDESGSVVSTEEESGVSWGEILEYVSGRRELPAWPPFTLSADAPGLASVADAPMQKLDVDIPEEYRAHYIRQSKKTKQVVQAWLVSQPEIRTSPPQEVDDETLMFAMITHLEPDKRRLFTALLRGMSTLPISRAPTPMEKPKSELMIKSGQALQRLYRLRSIPRDAECAIFLLKNPELHSVLATLAAISSGEWDVLVSGRFDGFLWSGAENSGLPSRGPTPASPPSRLTTPANAPPGTPFGGRGAVSRGPTPAPGSFGAPVQMDEDTEITVLAEVEREIYAGMDALEDAFERLHTQAEQVRAALRARGAGLSMTASARRGSNAESPEIRLGTPAYGAAAWAGWDTETDDGMETRSELAPDDSASNISHHRRRRRPDRRELRTPGTVTEEDEPDAGPGESKTGRRR